VFKFNSKNQSRSAGGVKNNGSMLLLYVCVSVVAFAVVYVLYHRHCTFKHSLNDLDMKELRLRKRLEQKKKSLTSLKNAFGGLLAQREVYKENADILGKAEFNLKHVMESPRPHPKIIPTSRDFEGMEIYGDYWTGSKGPTGLPVKYALDSNDAEINHQDIFIV